MNIVYPINGKNERMGSLFSTPKHLLLYKGKKIIIRSIETIKKTFPDSNITILTNTRYYEGLKAILGSDIGINIIGETSSQVETLRTFTSNIVGQVMFIDCDIIPFTIGDFNKDYPTVFTFLNKTKLLNYSNFKRGSNNNIVSCNEKQKLYKYAGAGIYYFPKCEDFNKYSIGIRSVSECINLMISDGLKCKINTNSDIGRFGTLQDIYVDNFSFRKLSQKDLSTGFTNNRVIKKGNTVIKAGDLVHIENDWYLSYKNKKHIPKILSYQENCLILEYINRDSDFNLDDIFELIESYKKYDKLNELKFDSYIQNIKKHLINNNEILNGKKLIDKLSELNIESTFCHGDLSVMNMIPTSNGIKLIDPLYSKDKFGSYEIDLAKLCFSFKFYKNDSASFNYVKEKSNIKYLDALIAAEAVRVSSYKKEYSFISENLINEL
jgi:thiamine kinase-like enzyme